jgi:hypothetical protein
LTKGALKVIKRKVYGINEVDTSIPAGGIVSISPYHSYPCPPNRLETVAMGIFIERHMSGNQVKMRAGLPNYGEDVYYRNSEGNPVVITRDFADDPNASYAIIPYRIAASTVRTTFAKNFVIVDKTMSPYDYLVIDSINVGADARFIPIRAESLLTEELIFAINSL